MTQTPELAAELVETVRRVRDEMAALLLSYRFGMQEITTKVEILRQEFAHLHEYNPIDHVASRLKKPESILDKVVRKGYEPTLDSIRANVVDVAGVRVTCSFTSDVYRVYEALTAQPDVRVLTVKDYIASPKPNGYRSLHAIIEVPVFLSTTTVKVPVEVQFRTVAMDFWASLEHKIFYKFDGAVPPELVARLGEAAATAAELDREMEDLHDTVHGSRTVALALPTDEQDPISDEVVRRLVQNLVDRRGV